MLWTGIALHLSYITRKSGPEVVPWEELELFSLLVYSIHTQHKRREDYTVREQKRRSFPDDLYPPKTDRNEERRGSADTRISKKREGSKILEGPKKKKKKNKVGWIFRIFMTFSAAVAIYSSQLCVCVAVVYFRPQKEIHKSFLIDPPFQQRDGRMFCVYAALIGRYDEPQRVSSPKNKRTSTLLCENSKSTPSCELQIFVIVISNVYLLLKHDEKTNFVILAQNVSLR